MISLSTHWIIQTARMPTPFPNPPAKRQATLFRAIWDLRFEALYFALLLLVEWCLLNVATYEFVE